MVKQLEELNNIIWLMIIDSYGLGEKWKSLMMRSKTLLRVMKYMAPPAGEYKRALHAHTDKLASAILCEDQISGLEIEIKDGNWIKVSPSPASFLFLVADPLMVCPVFFIDNNLIYRKSCKSQINSSMLFLLF